MNGRTDEYTYDADGRLIREAITHDPAAPDRTYTYTYDLAGNRYEMIDTANGGSDLTYTYDGDGRLTDVSGTSAGSSYTASYTYDENGSTLTQTINGQVTTDTWDLEGRLISSVTTGGQSSSYAYDDSGNRVSQTVNGQTTTYLNDPNQAYDQVLEEYGESGGNAVLAATYVRGLDLLFQDRTATGGGAGLSYYAVDGLGSTRALTSSAGTPTDTYAYDAYGDLTGQTWMGTAATPNEFLYAGYRIDTATGQYDTESRIYDASAGRFTSRDSYEGSVDDPITLEKYLYGSDDPVDRIDPGGNSDFSLGSISASVGINMAISSGFTAAYGAAKGWSVSRIAWASGISAAIAAGATLGFFGLAYGLAAGGISSSTALISAGIIVTPSALGLAIGNFKTAMESGDGVDKAFATVNLALAAYGAWRVSTAAGTIPARERAIAEATAERLLAIRRGFKRGAAGVTVVDGDPFPGRSTKAGGADMPVDPAVQKILDGLEELSDFHGKCVEPRSITGALDAGRDVNGAWSAVVSVARGTPMKACKSCEQLLKALGINDATVVGFWPLRALLSSMANNTADDH